MKAAPFEFLRAGSIEEALDALAQHGPEAKLIAGGQSLVPMMAMRLVRPSWLIDINDVAALKGVRIDGQTVRVGAATRQCEVARDRALAQAMPLIGKALAWVGHVQTRNRGTIGGSLVHADPSAEMPLAALVLDAQLVIRDRRGEQTIAARDFFMGPMSTAIDPTQCLVDVQLPRRGFARVGSAFDEVAIRHGDFAIVSAAAEVGFEGDRCCHASIGIGGAAPTPLAFPALAERLVGTRADDATIDAIAADAARECEPGNDLHASADYRRHLARVLVARVLRQARAEA